jgi:FkbM family methyltransferase
MYLWMALSQKAAVVFDVGANTGVYSLVAAAMNPAAHVYGFEPLTCFFEQYDRNCRLNGFDIHAYKVAVSDETGVGTMCGWTLGKGNEASAPASELVATRRLDSLIDACGLHRVDLVKIDVEGHEPEVLQGMGPFLEKFRPTLLIEVLSDDAGERLEAALGDLGYLYFDLDDAGPPRLSRRIRTSSHWNYLICQPGVAETLGLG